MLLFQATGKLRGIPSRCFADIQTKALERQRSEISQQAEQRLQDECQELLANAEEEMQRERALQRLSLAASSQSMRSELWIKRLIFSSLRCLCFLLLMQLMEGILPENVQSADLDLKCHMCLPYKAKSWSRKCLKRRDFASKCLILLDA